MHSALLALWHWIQNGWKYIDRRWVIPLMRRLGRWLLARVDRKSEAYGLLGGWKTDALDDFRAWLEDLPAAEPPRETAGPEACDLYTLLAEFSALRQEIKLQSREQHKVTANLDSLVASYRESASLFQHRTRDMDRLAANIRDAVEKETVIPFLFMRDALVRGHEAARKAAGSRSFFRRPPEGLDGVVEGYDMALRRFDRALEQVNIRRVEAVGRPFDPKAMKAVGSRRAPDQDKGMVVAEELTGFVRGEEVIRTAEVIVSA